MDQQLGCFQVIKTKPGRPSLFHNQRNGTQKNWARKPTQGTSAAPSIWKNCPSKASPCSTVQVFFITLKDFRSTPDSLFKGGIDFLQHWDSIQTQFIPPKSIRMVRAVRHIRKTAQSTVLLYLAAGNGKKRPNNISPHRRDAGKSFRTCSFCKVHQHGFCTVRKGMGSCNAVLSSTEFPEKRIADFAPAFFQPLPLFPGQSTHIRMQHPQGNPTLFTKAPHKLLIGIRFFPAQSVIDMSCQKGNPIELPETKQEICQRNGIRTT